MQKKNFFIPFVILAILVAVISPAAASLSKITAGAPVYIGEQNLDISSGLSGCRVIGWWADGSDLSGPAAKTVAIYERGQDSDRMFSFSIDPQTFNGYTGPWYCEEKQPRVVVFNVSAPRLTARFWDMDTGTDITGQTVPEKTNITYRIDTNLDQALQYRYRPQITPLDSFYNVTLTDPHGNLLKSLTSGTFGKAESRVFPFDTKPYVTISPWYYTAGAAWDPASRNAHGYEVYSTGTYTVTVKQNLNRMETSYATLEPESREGLTESTATVTFIKPERTIIATTTTKKPAAATTTVKTTQTAAAAATTAVADTTVTKTTVPTKTTYSPLDPLITGIALCIPGFFLLRKRA